MKYVYILLICLILFYILSRFFEKYYSQENFDPSLVPVSSIITLAKVAQKIVDGNGTLTNPANLNIGTTTGPGNLLVTGNSTTNGNKQIDGNTTVGGTLGVAKDTSITSNLGVAGYSFLSGGARISNLNVVGNTTLSGPTILGTTGTPASLTVNGDTKITGDTTIKALTISGANIDPTFKFGDNTGHTLKFLSSAIEYKPGLPPKLITDNVDTGTSITDKGDVNVGNTLNVGQILNVGQTLNVNARSSTPSKNVQGYTLYSQNGDYFGIWRNVDLLKLDSGGNLTVNSINIVPRGCIMMWNGPNIPAGWVLCDGNQGTPDLRNRLIQGGSGGAGYGESRETGKGTAGADEGAKNRNSNIYTINFIMKT